MGYNDRLDENGYEDFLLEVINGRHLEGAALGITKLVIDKGASCLTSKQSYVFRTEVEDIFITEHCSRCGCDIPWSEMYEAYDNRGMCGWCAHQVAKDD